ncbi:MAG: hypothetical protein GY857_05775 [Desulfobacula sp.]|nr:hypothetical protein [Desulfobacula sp.]
MKITRIVTTVFLLTTLIGLTACVHNFPQQTSVNEGVLIIPHKADNQTEATEFGYYYYLEYTPETSVKIKIMPNTSKDFFMIPNFPAGKYRATHVVTVGIRDRRVNAYESRKIKRIRTIPFEIKPGEVTILDNSFDVSKEGSASQWTQYRDIGPLFKEAKDKIIQKLSKFKNSQLWILPPLKKK